LKLRYDRLLSHFGFEFHLRRYDQDRSDQVTREEAGRADHAAAAAVAAAAARVAEAEAGTYTRPLFGST